MADLTKERMAREERWTYRRMLLSAGEHAFKGGLACIDKSVGELVQAADSRTDLLPIGFFAETKDNTLGSDAVPVNVRFKSEKTVHWLANDSGDLVEAADIGSPCYILDDQTVKQTAGSNSVAGTVWAVDAAKGVAVELV